MTRKFKMMTREEIDAKFATVSDSFKKIKEARIAKEKAQAETDSRQDADLHTTKAAQATKDKEQDDAAQAAKGAQAAKDKEQDDADQAAKGAQATKDKAQDDAAQATKGAQAAKDKEQDARHESFENSQKFRDAWQDDDLKTAKADQAKTDKKQDARHESFENSQKFRDAWQDDDIINVENATHSAHENLEILANKTLDAFNALPDVLANHSYFSNMNIVIQGLVETLHHVSNQVFGSSDADLQGLKKDTLVSENTTEPTSGNDVI